MKLSGTQLERLAERVFRTLKLSGHIEIDTAADERAEDRVQDTILTVLEDDSRTEDRLSREAERLVSQQTDVARQSTKSMTQLVEEVKARLAKSKRVLIDDGPERADSIAEKVVKSLWRIDCVDFFADDRKVQNCIARAIHRFRHEDDRLIEAVERVVGKKTTEEMYSPQWSVLFDRYFLEVKTRLADRQHAANEERSRSHHSSNEQDSVEVTD